MSAEDAAKKDVDGVVAAEPASSERAVVESSLSKADISIILGRTLEKGGLVNAVDLSNCNDADIAMMRVMVSEELNLRMAGRFTDDVVLEGLKFNYSGAKSDLLTRQLDLRDKDLTDKQVDCLIRILGQLGSKIEGYIAKARGDVKKVHIPED